METNKCGNGNCTVLGTEHGHLSSEVRAYSGGNNVPIDPEAENIAEIIRRTSYDGLTDDQRESNEADHRARVGEGLLHLVRTELVS